MGKFQLTRAVEFRVSFEVFRPDQIRPPDAVMILTPIYVKADWQVN